MRALAWLFLMLSGLALEQETQVFRANTNLVTLTFSVRNSSGALLENLTKDDVEVFEEGRKGRSKPLYRRDR